MRNIKLMGIIEDIGIMADERPKVNKHEVIEAVKSYARIGKQIQVNNNIMEASKQLSKIAEAAQNHILSETDDWFDGVSVKRNMKEQSKTFCSLRRYGKYTKSLL